MKQIDWGLILSSQEELEKHLEKQRYAKKTNKNTRNVP
jgi:hypothetical protein